MSLADKPAELIHHVFQFKGAFLQPIQVEEELVKLVEDVRELRHATILEIGTSMGGTLYLWTRLAQSDALIISADLPGGKFGGGYSPLRTPIYRRFARDRQKLHLMRANSHEASTLAEIRRLLNGRDIDFLFIDGDHTYEGVKQDWEMYSPLVRPGGLIAFHDVAGNYDDTQVKRHWDEIKAGYVHREYMVHPRGFYGLGVLVKPE
jgi:predicted O-methyltransferase YrrM